MPIPESAVLKASRESKSDKYITPVDKLSMVNDVITIKEIICFNDFVALLQFRVQTMIELGEDGFKNEGMVIGFGPGLPANNGSRCPSQMKLGKVIAFMGKPATQIVPNDGVYKGQRIIIIPERAILCELPSVPFAIEQPK